MKKILIKTLLLTSLITVSNAETVSEFCELTKLKSSDRVILDLYPKPDINYGYVNRTNVLFKIEGLAQALQMRLPDMSIVIKNNSTLNFNLKTMILNFSNFYYKELINEEDRLAFFAMIFKPHKDLYFQLKEGILNEVQFQALGVIEKNEAMIKMTDYRVEAYIFDMVKTGVKKTKAGKGYLDPEFQNFFSAVLTGDFDTAKKILRNSNYEEVYEAVDKLCEFEIKKNGGK